MNFLKNTRFNVRVQFTFICIAYLFASNTNRTFAQTTQLEHSATSYVGTIPSGPLTSYQKARFVNNTSGQTFETFNPDITVTAWLSDQQFNNVAGVNNLKGIFFGGSSNDNAKTVTAQPVWKAVNSISSPTDNLFTSNPIGTSGQGISVDVNHGFNIFTAVEPLYAADKNRADRYYYGKLTLKFTRATSNPVLHIVGLGGSTGATGDVLGYTTELELDNATNIQLQQLSGNGALKVENNKILNNKSTINDQSSDGAASGSIRVQGTNITTLVFKIYLRGDGKGSSWSGQNIFRGDQWMMALSMNAPSISGHVYDDGNGLKDFKVNPFPKATNFDNKLRINLLSGSSLISSADVGEDGEYIFQDIVSENYPAAYKMVLTAGEHADISKLPTGWSSTGEYLGAETNEGNDDNIDGKLAVTLANATTGIFNANFGINKMPISEPINGVERSNPGGTNKVTVPMLTGTDNEDGDYVGSDNTNTIKINTLPDPVLGALYYDGKAITAAQVITGYEPAKLVVDPADGEVIVTFTYSHKDAAGSYSEAAEVSIPFYQAFQIGGNVSNDINGMLGKTPNANKVDGPGVKGSDLGKSAGTNAILFVSVVYDKAILATTPVGEGGDFQFDKTFEPKTYDLVLHMSEEGSVSPKLPDLWMNTGENTDNAEGCDGNPNGVFRCTLTSKSALDIRFGINKIPEASEKIQTISKPGTDVFITLDGSGPAPAIAGYDLEDKVLGGAGSKVVITKLPTNGQLYYGDQQITIINTVISTEFKPALFKIKLSGSAYSSSKFSYAFIDQANAQGTSADYQLVWNSALPVKLSAFSASQQERIVKITWSTVQESNSERFDIEHSTDGKDWNIIGTVLAQGESNTQKSYLFEHLSPTAGQNLYRLKMVDSDHSFATSRIINVSFKGENAITIYPNPATEYIKINTGTSNTTPSIVETMLLDMNGKIVVSDRSGSSQINLKGCAPGLYALKIQQVNGIVSMHKISIKN